MDPYSNMMIPTLTTTAYMYQQQASNHDNRSDGDVALLYAQCSSSYIDLNGGDNLMNDTLLESLLYRPEEEEEEEEELELEVQQPHFGKDSSSGTNSCDEAGFVSPVRRPEIEYGSIPDFTFAHTSPIGHHAKALSMISNPTNPLDKRTKRRKCVYAVRRNELASLKKEYKFLENKLKGLQWSRRENKTNIYGPTTKRTNERRPSPISRPYDNTTSSINSMININEEEQKEFENAVQVNTKLRHAIANQQFQIGILRALLSGSPISDIRMTLVVPVTTYIHLDDDHRSRRQTLSALKDYKLDACVKFVEEKTQHLEIGSPFFFGDRFEKFGNLYNVDFLATKLEDVTVKEVLDVIHYVVMNINSMLNGKLEVVEYQDLDRVDRVFLHNRLVTSSEKTIPVDGTLAPYVEETNTVFFAKYNNRMAVLVADNVDRDDLHPYRAGRGGLIRCDTTSGITLTQFVDRNGVSCVMLKKFALSKRHLAHCDGSEGIQEDAASRTAMFSEMIMEEIHSRRAATTTVAA